MRIETTSDLFLNEVQDLYDAEKQLLRALPRLAKKIGSQELAAAMRDHVEQTRNQIGRLEQIFEMLGQRARSHPCKGMKGLVEEAQELAEEDRSSALDCALAGAGRKVEHYEMAGYLSAQETARGLGHKDAAQLLAQTLEEEKEMDRRLKQLSGQLLKAASGSAARSASKAASNGRSAKKATAKASAKRASGRKSAALTKTTTDHEEIRRWAEERGARPACVKGTGKGRPGYMIRLDFPGFSGEDSLEEITWDDFFQQFDENSLALIYQEKTAQGKSSNFNKFVSRE